jgi:hypothetical protein
LPSTPPEAEARHYCTGVVEEEGAKESPRRDPSSRGLLQMFDDVSTADDIINCS